MKVKNLKFLLVKLAQVKKNYQELEAAVTESRRELFFIREIHGYDSTKYNAAVKKQANLEQEFERVKATIRYYEKLIKGR